MVTAKNIEDTLINSSLRLASTSFDGDQPLEEQGIDSMDIVVLLMAVEERFEVKLLPKDIGSLRSLNAIANFVNIAKNKPK